MHHKKMQSSHQPTVLYLCGLISRGCCQDWQLEPSRTWTKSPPNITCSCDAAAFTCWLILTAVERKWLAVALAVAVVVVAGHGLACVSWLGAAR